MYLIMNDDVDYFYYYDDYDYYCYSYHCFYSHSCRLLVLLQMMIGSMMANSCLIGELLGLLLFRTILTESPYFLSFNHQVRYMIVLSGLCDCFVYSVIYLFFFHSSHHSPYPPHFSSFYNLLSHHLPHPEPSFCSSFLTCS